MPWIVPGIAVLIGIAAGLDPANWPTRMETARVLGSLVLLPAAARLPSRPGRLAAALAWVAVLVSTRTPVPAHQVAADFRTFYEGAQALFGTGRSPYTAPGATAFPFPTFPLVHLLGGGGRLGMAETYLAFTVLQVALLGLMLALALRLREAGPPRPARDAAGLLLQAGLLAQPPILAGLSWGNSGALGGALVSLTLWWWLRGRARGSLHAAAIALSLAWMVKPQLLMTVAFFLAAAALDLRRDPAARSRAGALGRLVLPWSAALLAMFGAWAYPVSLQAYGEFLHVATRWHTEIAETHSNNLALSAVLAGAAARILGVHLTDILPIASAAVGVLVLSVSLGSLRGGRSDTVTAILPWLLASLLWTSLVWDWYLTLILAAPLLLAGMATDSRGDKPKPLALWAGIACCTTASRGVFPLGITLLYLYALTVRWGERPSPAGPEPQDSEGPAPKQGLGRERRECAGEET
jgi:hypothetical protein